MQLRRLQGNRAWPPTKWKNCYGRHRDGESGTQGEVPALPPQGRQYREIQRPGQEQEGRHPKTGTWSTTRTCKVKSTANVTVAWPAALTPIVLTVRTNGHSIECTIRRS